MEDTSKKLEELYDKGKIVKVSIDSIVYESDPIQGPIPTRVRDWNQKHISMLYGLHFYASADDAKEMGDKLLHDELSFIDVKRMCDRYNNPFYEIMMKNARDFKRRMIGDLGYAEE